MLFSEELHRTKNYESMKDLWQVKFSDKHIVSSFAKSLGIKIPELYCLCDKAEHLPILEKCVIKPTKGSDCANVYLIKNGIDQFTGKKVIKENLVKKISIPYWEGAKIQFICEEYLDDESGHHIPIDYKFYVFGGEKIGGIHQIKRFNNKELCHMWYDENFNPIPELKTKDTVTLNEITAPPKCFEQMKKDVLKIAKHIGIFMRIDMYATTKGSYFGETTHYPSAGIDYTPYGDKLLGDIWQQYPDQHPQIPFIF